MKNSAEAMWAHHRRKQQGESPKELAPLRNKVAVDNDRLAIQVARRYMERCNLPLEDLIQLSRIGLLKAVERFDPTAGAAFSSFAVPYCEGEIKHFLRDNKHLIKTPRRWVEKRDSVEALKRRLQREGREVSLDQVAELGMGLAPEQWQTISHATAGVPLKSLEGDALQIQIEESTEALEEQEQRERLQRAIALKLSSLPEKLREPIVERFWHELPDKIIAKRHGISVAEVQSLISQGLEQLRATC